MTAKRLSSAERFPSLCAPIRDGDDERQRARNVAQALRNMTSLKTFIWIQPWASHLWRDEPDNYTLVFQALSESRSLKELRISDASNEIAHKFICRPSLVI